MGEMSAIPPAMTDIERTSRAARLLRRLGVVGPLIAEGTGGVHLQGSRPGTRSIVPPSPTHQPKLEGEAS